MGSESQTQKTVVQEDRRRRYFGEVSEQEASGKEAKVKVKKDALIFKPKEKSLLQCA